VDWAGIIENAARAAIGKDAIVYALAAIGLNVHFGYTGLLNFGQAGFLAMGAYGTAITVTYFEQSIWLGILVAILAAVVLALLLGVPTLRLRADYLAIVTIAGSEIIRLCVRSVTFGDVTGGSTGLNSFAGGFYDVNFLPSGTHGFGPWRFSSDTWWWILVGWGLVALSALLVFALIRSPWGRVLKSIREDEDAARSLGKNVFSYKMQALVLGGVIGALGGIINALATRAVQPDNFSTNITFFAYTALILGGAARTFGPIIGSMIFWVLLAFTDSALREASANDLLPSSIISGAQIGQVRFMLVGLGLALLMIFRPQGIFGDRRELELDAR
jgi:branched-chain amino acid transport system permease protein